MPSFRMKASSVTEIRKPSPSIPKGSRTTTLSFLANRKHDRLGRFLKGNISPNWLGENPPAPTGKMFGYWRVLSRNLLRKKGELYVRCLCTSCEKEFDVSWHNLKSGKTQSCNTCGQRRMIEARKVAEWGRATDALDHLFAERWRAIMQRCYDPSCRVYKDYGGRGIRLHPDFHNKIDFVDYIRTLPNACAELSLDRIDVNGDYAPGNLRFATQSEQCLNQRKTVYLKYDGKTWPATLWARRYSRFAANTVTRLARKGLTGEEILARENDPNPGLRPRKRRSKKQVLDGSLNRP